LYIFLIIDKNRHAEENQGMSRTSYDPSKDRQRLDRIAQEIRKVMGLFCRHEPIVQGVVTTLRRACGKQGCRCKKGPLHETVVFLWRSHGRRHTQKLSQAELKILRKATRLYRALRRLRAELGVLHREATSICDRLSQDRLVAGLKLFTRLGLQPHG
jgi:hypothetical protein